VRVGDDSCFSSHSVARTVFMNALSVSGERFAARNSVAMVPSFVSAK